MQQEDTIEKIVDLHVEAIKQWVEY
jgi:hypothetical protein